jgi:hypothetical protein
VRARWGPLRIRIQPPQSHPTPGRPPPRTQAAHVAW